MSPKRRDPKTLPYRRWRFYTLLIMVLCATALALFVATDTSASAGLRALFQARTPRPGVRINLTNVDGSTIITSTVTDAQGHWSFDYLQGNYAVQIDPSNFLPGGALYGESMTASACGINNNNLCAFTYGGTLGVPSTGFQFSFGHQLPTYSGYVRVTKPGKNIVEGWNGSALALYGDNARYNKTFTALNGMTNTGSLDVGAFTRILPQPTQTVTNNSVITLTGSYQPIMSAGTVSTTTLGDAYVEVDQQKLLRTPSPLPTPWCRSIMAPYPYCTSEWITQTYSSSVRWATSLTLQNVGAYPITVFYQGLTPVSQTNWDIWTNYYATTMVGQYAFLSFTLAPGSAREMWYDRYYGWVDLN